MSLLDYFNPSKLRAREKVIRVRITKSTTARHYQKEDLMDVSAGDEVDAFSSDASNLITAGAAVFVAELDSDGQPLPPKKKEDKKPSHVAESAPVNFKDLPAVFTSAWDLLERRRILEVEIKEAVNLLIQQEGGIVEGKIQRGADEIERRKDRLAEFDSKEAHRIYDSVSAAGNAVLNKMGEANQKTRELSGIGLEIFTHRVAALELPSEKIMQLFKCSTIGIRYARFTEMSGPRVTSLGGNRGDILDLPLHALVSHYLYAAGRISELDQLIAQARAELAAAQGVTAKTKRVAA